MQGEAVVQRQAYVKYFPFEIPFLLYQFSEHFYRLLYQQYFFQQLSKEALEGDLGASNTTRQCFTQSYVANYTGDEEFVRLQERVNRLNMYSELTFLGFSLLVGLVLGPLSDIVGRKPIMLTAVVGLCLTAILQFAIIHFSLNVYYYLLCSLFFGASGGFATVMTVIVATVHDVTPNSSKAFTIRIGIVESCIAIAKATTSIATNDWIQKTNCNFEPPAWLMITITALAMITVILMPESLSKKVRLHNQELSNRGFSKIVTGIKLYVMPSYIGSKNYLILWTATVIICLASLGLGASNSIMNYFLHNEPLQWTYDRIGTYGAIYSAAMGVSLILLLPILVFLRLSIYYISLIGASAAVVTNILIANINSKSTSEMFVLGIFQGLLILVYPTIRSCIAEVVGPERQGSAFSIATSCQVVAGMASIVASNEIYHPQVSSHTDAGIVFWIMAGAWSVTIPLILLLAFKDKLCKNKSALSQAEKKSYGTTIQ